MKRKPSWLEARHLQILILSGLLLAGVLQRDFSIHLSQIILTFAGGFTTQFLFIRILKLKNVGYLSAFVTCLALSLLLRADRAWIHPSIAAISIAGKFLIRFRGKHIFNPANLGIILGILAVKGAWVSSGQWGHDIIYAAWFFALGSWVTRWVKRIDVTFAFFLSYVVFVTMRMLWLGESFQIWRHQFLNGSLLLFSFFMISDPMTSPNHVLGRVIHGVMIAFAAYWIQFHEYQPNGVFYALFGMSFLVPLWDQIWPSSKFSWRRSPAS